MSAWPPTDGGAQQLLTDDGTQTANVDATAAGFVEVIANSDTFGSSARSIYSCTPPGGNPSLEHITVGEGRNIFVTQDDGTWQVTPSSVGTVLAADHTGIAFFGAATRAKPTITGSKAANAALSSLLAQLALLGLVTDNTT